LTLPEEDFAKPTRLPAWNVKELLGHLYRGIDRTNWALDDDEPVVVDEDAVSYWRRYDPSHDATDIADRAKEVADRFGSGQELAAAWDDLWRRSLGRAATADPGRPMKTWEPVLTLDDFVRTRVLELTVHRADIMDALGLPADPSEAGLEITQEILVGLLDADITAIPDWNGVDFIEKGTGRRPLSEEDRAALGDLADRFPLIS
ncbi:MAG TPA: maleylpyruvate isomerase N-terminal domain-containing protein, partial [Actinomycetota bacterium]